MSEAIELATAICSATGTRASNEDKVRVCREGARWIAVVADGAGGHRHGAEASRRAVDSLESSLCETDADFSHAVLTAAVVRAHDQVQEAQEDAHGSARMHSTVVVLWVDCDTSTALWSHVGDSRLYRVRDGVVEPLTSDDSVVQRMMDAGLITPREAESHPGRNQLVSALGIEGGVEPRTVDAPQPVAPGDAFLLCSDGWWGAIDRHGIVDALAGAAGPDDWLSSMQQRIEALARPRQDNYSAVAIWVREYQQTTVPMSMPAS